MKLVIDIPDNEYKFIKDLQSLVIGGRGNCRTIQRDVINAIKKGTPYEERPKGKWSEHEDYCGDTYYTCSNCGEDWCFIEGTPVDNMMNFCPNCGAQMKTEV